MNSRVTTQALLLASMMFASNAFATDINKCVTATGGVTLTDAACPTDTQAVKVISVPNEATADETVSAAPARPSVVRYASQRMPVRYATVMRTPQPARGLSLDIATLKTARANMALFDSASQSMRSQRLAGLQ